MQTCVGVLQAFESTSVGDAVVFRFFPRSGNLICTLVIPLQFTRVRSRIWLWFLRTSTKWQNLGTNIVLCPPFYPLRYRAVKCSADSLQCQCCNNRFLVGSGIVAATSRGCAQTGRRVRSLNTKNRLASRFRELYRLSQHGVRMRKCPSGLFVSNVQCSLRGDNKQDTEKTLQDIRSDIKRLREARVYRQEYEIPILSVV